MGPFNQTYSLSRVARTMLTFFIAMTGLCLTASSTANEIPVTTVDELLLATDTATAGDVIRVAKGTYELPRQLKLSSGIQLIGAGIDQTILTHRPEWAPSTQSLPDPETKTQGLDSTAYLIHLQKQASRISVSNMTLLGPQLHGAIFGHRNSDLELHHLKIQDTLWSGIRTLSMQNASIHDCQFIDAGGRWKRGGIPGSKGGITGGAVFATWMKDSRIFDNVFRRTQSAKQDEFYGIKVRQAKHCRIHHNTIEVNFSLELPFENDEDVEIDHNDLHGTVSIPKHSGGSVPESGRTFHIHHNLFRDTYSIEFVRNGVEVDHNLFHFDVTKDHGNLISGFGKAPASGPALIHNNLISNPGRGVVWINEPYSHLVIRNNHIVTRTTKTPRTEGLFGFNRDCEFGSIVIQDNIIECIGTSHPLFRNDESYRSVVTNNKLINVADADRFPKSADKTNSPGPQSTLNFRCGANERLHVDGWQVQQIQPDN